MTITKEKVTSESKSIKKRQLKNLLEKVAQIKPKGHCAHENIQSSKDECENEI